MSLPDTVYDMIENFIRNDEALRETITEIFLFHATLTDLSDMDYVIQQISAYQVLLKLQFNNMVQDINSLFLEVTTEEDPIENNAARFFKDAVDLYDDFERLYWALADFTHDRDIVLDSINPYIRDRLEYLEHIVPTMSKLVSGQGPEKRLASIVLELDTWAGTLHDHLSDPVRHIAD